MIDDEMLSHVYRIIRGIEVNDETLGFEGIAEAVAGEGHFLGGPRTIASMQRDYFYPKLADRDSPDAWEEGGALDIWQRAKLRVDELLNQPHGETMIDAEADQKIRENLQDPPGPEFDAHDNRP